MRRNRGVALITVMLILTIATVMAVGMASAMQMDIRRSSNVINHEQVYQYVTGAEAWTFQILFRDRKDNKTDSLQDDWANLLPPVPIEGGQIAGSIEDLQGRFNLNSLLKEDGKDNQDAIAQLRRILRQLEINEDMVLVMLDWMDRDENLRAGGAEDHAYQALATPYRVANREFISVSELLLLDRMDYASYQKLSPHVIALPVSTRININTASAQVLASLSDKLSNETVTALLDKAKQDGFKSVDEFLKQPGVTDAGINKDILSVESGYFRLHAHVNIGSLVVSMVTDMYRDSSGTTQVIRRYREQL